MLSAFQVFPKLLVASALVWSCADRAEAGRAFESKALTYINPEIAWNGGILESFKTAQLANRYNVRVAPHCYVGPISALASAHVSSFIHELKRSQLTSGSD